MIFGFLSQNLKTQAVAVAFSIAWPGSEVEPRAEDDGQARDRLAAFRGELYRCFTARADALFELADAVLCADGPVKTLVGLSLAPEHQRGHGALYDAVNCGRVEIAGLEPGRTSWTAVLDAVRLGPGDDETAVTAAQVRDVVARLIEAGHWRQGDPAILVVFDAGYDIARLGYLLAGLPVEVLGRLRSSRVLCLPPPPRRAGAGRPARHGAEFKLADEASWPAPAVTTSTQTARYGTAVATAWDRLHPRLTHRAAWEDHSDGELPILEGTLIRLQVDHLPGDRDPKPVWLWHSATGATPAGVDRCWQAFLRRFDLEHTFRLFKQVLGSTAPKVRDPAAADPCTWLIIACHTQLRLARDLAADLRRPWEKPAPPGRLTPARVRRGFRNIHATTAHPASAPKSGKPGPGRPPGSRNHRPAASHNVGKNPSKDTANTGHKKKSG